MGFPLVSLSDAITAIIRAEERGMSSRRARGLAAVIAQRGRDRRESGKRSSLLQNARTTETGSNLVENLWLPSAIPFASPRLRHRRRRLEEVGHRALFPLILVLCSTAALPARILLLLVAPVPLSAASYDAPAESGSRL